MKAVFLDFGALGPDTLDSGPLLAHLPELEAYDNTPANHITERITAAEFVFVNKVELDAETLRDARQLKYIGLAATGTDNVDLEYAREHGIAVANIRAYCTQSVVEHVFAMVLTLTHSTHRYLKDVQSGQWQKASQFCLLTHPIRELSTMTIGIVGYGTLGQAVAATAERFGMRVLVARRRGVPANADDGRVSFAELIEKADVVSLHLPLQASTRHLIGASELNAMRSDAFLINTARGGLIDSEALAAALASGAIAGAAIDVLPEEPPLGGNPLLDYRGDNLLLTPHIAWATREARQNALNEVAANVAAFQAGKKRNRVV